MKVSVSILSSSIKAEEITKKLDASSCNYVHIDIMDGKFVENKTWTYGEIKKITSYTHKPLDVHLMVKDPLKYIEDYALLNTDRITFHYEAVKDIPSMIETIKNYGLKVGIAVNPDTDVSVLYPYLKDIDEVLIMSVFPGKSGQSFIMESVEKIRKVKEEIINNNLKTEVEVDGGVNNETGLLCSEAGVDILVSASYVHNNIYENINILKGL